jgi:YD repeat-containing protein
VTSGEPLTQIIVTDATGTVTTSTQDSASRLLEQTINGQDGSLLRRETYTYDSLNRMTSETQWLSPTSSDTFTDLRPLTTTYAYGALRSLTALPGSADQGVTIINGYTVAVTDPYGRTQRFIYDAHDRIRQAEDTSGRIIRYDYSTSDPGMFTNGLRITRRDVLNNRLLSTTDYIFDLRWQLRTVTQDDATWELLLVGDTTRIRAIRAPQDGVREQLWDDYDQGRPSGVETTQMPLSLVSGTRLPSPSLDVTYDFQGRPNRIADGERNTYNILYCPLENGGEKIVTLKPDATVQSCDRDLDGSSQIPAIDVIKAVYFDAQGRLISVNDTDGVRTYTYTPFPGGWVVAVAFSENDTDVLGSWELRYNGAGDLTQWTDENGIVHHYEHDMLGRLWRVWVEGQPEASFSFRYNEIDLLVSMLDDVGRGTYYSYDNLGRLSPNRMHTANATIFAADGMLSTIIFHSVAPHHS